VGEAVVDGLPALPDTLVQRHSEPITLAGWSLGGIFARPGAGDVDGARNSGQQ
jgi:hypothetical protein